MDLRDPEQSPDKGTAPRPFPSGTSERARDSVSRGRRRYRLSDEQIVSLPWEKLPVLLTLVEAATRSRLSSWTVRQAIHGGQLPVIAVGKRLLVPTTELQAWLERARTARPAVPLRARG